MRHTRRAERIRTCRQGCAAASTHAITRIASARKHSKYALQHPMFRTVSTEHPRPLTRHFFRNSWRVWAACTHGSKVRGCRGGPFLDAVVVVCTIQFNLFYFVNAKDAGSSESYEIRRSMNVQLCPKLTDMGRFARAHRLECL